MAIEVKITKNSKLPKLPENCFEPIGKVGWPPIYSWINNPSLGRNDLHCIEFSGERKKCVESESWCVSCLVGDVALLGLWKDITSMWLEGLELFN
jgi:hypothetical protein